MVFHSQYLLLKSFWVFKPLEGTDQGNVNIFKSYSQKLYFKINYTIVIYWGVHKILLLLEISIIFNVSCLPNP